jgi:prepilin signal peptidase PulO-like enzyme (type II secretory pathway)
MYDLVPILAAALVSLIPAFCVGFVAAAVVIIVAERIPAVQAARAVTPRLPDWLRTLAILVGLIAGSALISHLLKSVPRHGTQLPSEQAQLQVVTFVMVVCGVIGGMLGGWAAGLLRGRQKPKNE